LPFPLSQLYRDHYSAGQGDRGYYPPALPRRRPLVDHPVLEQIGVAGEEHCLAHPVVLIEVGVALFQYNLGFVAVALSIPVLIAGGKPYLALI